MADEFQQISVLHYFQISKLFFFCFMVPGIESQYQASQCVLCELFSKYDRACKQNTSENISSKNGEFQVRPEGKNSLNIGKS